jgi:ethanolamine utilization microcompartment shell protein EutS
MQPQYAGLMGTMMNGDIPIAGQSELYIEVAPGNSIYRIADVALKAADVRPGMQVVERLFGLLELHSGSSQAIRAAGSAILGELGLSEADAIKGQIISSEIITNVDGYQAQLINQTRRGSMLVPGESMLVVETTPAGYALYAANEAEKAADVKLVQITAVGPFGRLLMSGSTSQVQMAQQAALRSLDNIPGRVAPVGPGG